jgi:hypothetical protein
LWYLLNRRRIDAALREEMEDRHPSGAWCARGIDRVQPLDFAAYVSASAALVFAASIAALLPAWRTLRQDPLRALRQE